MPPGTCVCSFSIACTARRSTFGGNVGAAVAVPLHPRSTFVNAGTDDDVLSA
jgi:hypothetical protein